MTNYGLAYFLEDKTGQLTGSDFVDIYDRMRLSMRCTAHDTMHTAYMIYNTSSDVYQGSHPKPLVALDFGPNNSLGTVSFSPTLSMPMKKYLVKSSTLGGSKVRKFVASDGQEYRWSFRVQRDQEWTCTNASGYLIAYYSLKPSSEPEYAGSSGCSLTVEEAYPHLAPELLASLMIMRHIVAYNL